MPLLCGKFILLGLILFLASLTLAQSSCKNNACLSVVKSNSRHASFAGCTQFFKVTVTPKTTTTTSTISKTTRTVSTSTKTITTTAEITTTTKTNFITSTSTETETSTEIVTSGSESSTTTTTKDNGNRLAKRAKRNTPITTSQTTVPPYATSACVNTDRYSSACSCIKATHITTTVASPTATRKVTTKITSTRTVTTDETITDYMSTVTETTDSTLYAVATQTETTTRVVPPAPTPSLNNSTSAASDANYDDNTFSIDLPFNVSFYGQTSRSVIVSVNGFLSIDSPDIYGSYANGPLPEFENGSAHIPDYSLPDTALAVYWADLFLHTGDNQGIFYQISGTAPLRTAKFEWIVSRYSDRYAYYHFIISLPESNVGRARYAYYDVADNGESATVGAQSKPADMFTQYEYNTAGSIYPGLNLVYNQLNNMFEIDNGIGP